MTVLLGIVLLTLSALGCTQNYSALEGHASGQSGGLGGNGTGAFGGSAGAGGGTTGVAGGAAPGTGGSAGQSGVLLGPNLVTNGDFSNGQTDWNLTPPGAGTATVTVMNGQLCVTLSGTDDNATTVGWPAAGAQGVPLTAGATYEFSFQIVSSPTLLGLEDKVGSTLPPDYSADFDTMSDGPVSTPQVIAHEFTAAGDPSAGVAFTLNTVNGASAAVCLSNVSLRQVLNAGGAGGVGGTGGAAGGAAGTSGAVPPFG